MSDEKQDPEYPQNEEVHLQFNKTAAGKTYLKVVWRGNAVSIYHRD